MEATILDQGDRVRIPRNIWVAIGLLVAVGIASLAFGGLALGNWVNISRRDLNLVELIVVIGAAAWGVFVLGMAWRSYRRAGSTGSKGKGLQAYFDQVSAGTPSIAWLTITLLIVIGVASLFVAEQMFTGWLALGERADISRRDLNYIEWVVIIIAILWAVVNLITAWGFWRRIKGAWSWAQWILLLTVVVASGFFLSGAFDLHTVIPPGESSIFANLPAAQELFSPSVILVLSALAVYLLLTAELDSSPDVTLRNALAKSPGAGAIIGFVALFIVFSIATDLFLEPRALAGALSTNVTRGIIAIGITMLMISGEFDLSVGSIYGASALVFLLAMTEGVFGMAPLGPIPAAVVGLLFAGVLGLINGVIMIRTGIPSFIVTLGTLLAYRAIPLVVIPEGRIMRYADFQSEPPVINLPRWLIIPVALLLAFVIVLIGRSILPSLWGTIRARSSVLRDKLVGGMSNPHLPDLVAFGCAVVILFAFFLLPWMATADGSLNAANVPDEAPILTRIVDGDLEVLAPDLSVSSIWLIPVAGVVAGLLALWGILGLAYSRTASLLMLFAVPLALAHFALYFLQPSLQIHTILGNLEGTLGLGFWVTLVAGIGLVAQVFMPRPRVENGDTRQAFGDMIALVNFTQLVVTGLAVVCAIVILVLIAVVQVPKLTPGAIDPGESYEISFSAPQGSRLSFALNVAQSNDVFLATGEAGLPLFTSRGLPVSILEVEQIGGETGASISLSYRDKVMDVSEQLMLWDAGTEVNQLLGQGEAQTASQSGPNVGEAEDGVVQSSSIQALTGGVNSFQVFDLVYVTISTTSFTPPSEALIQLNSLTAALPDLAEEERPDALEAMLAVFEEGERNDLGEVLGTEDTESDTLVTILSALDDTELLETLAEVLGSKVDPPPDPVFTVQIHNIAHQPIIHTDEDGNETEVWLSFSPGAWVVHMPDVSLFSESAVASGGLEVLAEDGDPTALIDSLVDQPGVVTSGVANMSLLLPNFFNIMNGRFEFLPREVNLRSGVLVWVLLVIAFQFILNQTPYGNGTLAAGGNPDAARAQGINVNRVKITNFVICAMLAGVAGITNVARVTSVNQNLGDGLELEVIAASVIGGALLTGGYGSIFGALLGVFIFGMLQTGLVLVGMNPRLFFGVIGIIIIAAVVINTLARQQRE